MNNRYEPELGQALFGQPTKQFAVPAIMDAAIEAIACEIERVVGNTKHLDLCPMRNAAEAFRCATFGAWAYDWAGDEQPYNFCHPARGTCISWYKYSGRGMSANRDISPADASLILIDCLSALHRAEDGTEPFEFGPLGTVAYFGAAA